METNLIHWKWMSVRAPGRGQSPEDTPWKSKDSVDTPTGARYWPKVLRLDPRTGFAAPAPSQACRLHPETMIAMPHRAMAAPAQSRRVSAMPSTKRSQTRAVATYTPP